MPDKSGAEAAVELVGVLVGFFLRSWLVMLLIGALHSEYAQVPAVGYGTTLLLVLIAGWATYQSPER
jgi:hypothetical protein